MEASYYFIHSWRKTIIIKNQYRKGSTSSFKIYFKNATGQSMMAHAPPTNTWEAVVDQYNCCSRMARATYVPQKKESLNIQRVWGSTILFSLKITEVNPRALNLKKQNVFI